MNSCSEYVSSGHNDMFFRLCQQDLFAYADILTQSEAGVEGAITTDIWTNIR